MGFNLLDDFMDPVHDLGKVKINVSLFKTKLFCPSNIRKYFRASDESLAGDAPCI